MAAAAGGGEPLPARIASAVLSSLDSVSAATLLLSPEEGLGAGGERARRVLEPEVLSRQRHVASALGQIAEGFLQGALAGEGAREVASSNLGVRAKVRCIL